MRLAGVGGRDGEVTSKEHFGFTDGSLAIRTIELSGN